MKTEDTGIYRRTKKKLSPVEFGEAVIASSEIEKQLASVMTFALAVLKESGITWPATNIPAKRTHIVEDALHLALEVEDLQQALLANPPITSIAISAFRIGMRFERLKIEVGPWESFCMKEKKRRKGAAVHNRDVASEADESRNRIREVYAAIKDANPQAKEYLLVMRTQKEIEQRGYEKPSDSTVRRAVKKSTSN